MNKRETDPTRREFLVGGGALAGALVAGCAHAPPASPKPPTPRGSETPGRGPGDDDKPRIRAYRTLGRTGFRVSDIGYGCGRISDPNLVRYAYDRGVNLFDTAEGYGDGDSERMIGQAMGHLERRKVFIVTKLHVERADTEQSLVERFGRCLSRMRTDYVDALYTHAVAEVAMVKHPGFHAAVKRLKAAGKVRHAGISCHGPRRKDEHTMDRVLLAAVEDGRFDVMLMVYNFMNSAPGRKVLAACKEKNIGTTLMKVTPARLEHRPFNPDDPAEEHTRLLRLMMKKKLSREEAVEKLKQRIEGQRREQHEHKEVVDAFVARHGIKSEEALKKKSVQWALGDPGVCSVCVSMNDFEALDTFVPLSGTRLSEADERALERWAAAFGADYCRHGCAECAGRCPADVPVSTVMRYAYYFTQGRERHAMERYAALGGAGGARCLECRDPRCVGACPHGLSISAQLLSAHQLLTLV
jgi:predicted aldo/keto reductase-like oxidoreductase